MLIHRENALMSVMLQRCISCMAEVTANYDVACENYNIP